MPMFTVVLGGMERVYEGVNERYAYSQFRDLVDASKEGIGQAAGQTVTLYKDSVEVVKYSPERRRQ